MTTLPVIPKGIMSVEDAQLAVAAGAKAIMLSNHGGRQLDGSPSSLEVAIEIYNKAPEVFTQVEVYADGGVRYGTDVLKLLALGVKAVGLGRPFMYANCYGWEGVEKAIDLLKHEIAIDAANLGVGDLKKIDASYVSHLHFT
jgi:isopentenyl diphosphate isomerase/L-lactate dehydrogenase-like FMN-dependent dehydrogenase